jgi:hypothetical protein
MDHHSQATSLPPEESRRPILVSGAHRSGTTWVGKMLSASGEAAYISEPLNILHRPGIFKPATHYWYTYICSDNEHIFLPGFLQTLNFRYHLWDEIQALRSFKDLGRMGRDLTVFLRGRVQNLRPLLKDPFAVFSTPWFLSRLHCQVVITVRHPAAFVSSLKRLEWPFQLQHLLDQPLLMRDWLEPLRPQIESLLRESNGMIRQNSLLWLLIYSTVDRIKALYPEVLVVRHEDLSTHPVEGYQRLFAELELTFTSRAQQEILASSSAENPKELKKNTVHSVRLNSQASLENWKRRLSPDEIGQIRRITEETAARYYPELNWD